MFSSKLLRQTPGQWQNPSHRQDATNAAKQGFTAASYDGYSDVVKALTFKRRTVVDRGARYSKQPWSSHQEVGASPPADTGRAVPLGAAGAAAGDASAEYACSGAPAPDSDASAGSCSPAASAFEGGASRSDGAPTGNAVAGEPTFRVVTPGPG